MNCVVFRVVLVAIASAGDPKHFSFVSLFHFEDYVLKWRNSRSK